MLIILFLITQLSCLASADDGSSLVPHLQADTVDIEKLLEGFMHDESKRSMPDINNPKCPLIGLLKGPAKFCCADGSCPKTFTNGRGLLIHIKENHTEKKHHGCHDCSFSTGFLNTYTRHLKLHEKSESSEPDATDKTKQTASFRRLTRPSNKRPKVSPRQTVEKLPVVDLKANASLKARLRPRKP